MIKCVLLSVFDKQGLIDFVKGFVVFDYELILMGGIKKVLEVVDILVIGIEEVIGFFEMFDGWVKMFYFKVYVGLLV